VSNLLFRTVCQLGCWLHIDVMVLASRCKFGLTHNYVHFNLVNSVGVTTPIGFCILTDSGTGYVFDEDGVQFPDLDAAIQQHTRDLLRFEWRRGQWQSYPPAHPSQAGAGETVRAFDQDDIAEAIRLNKEFTS
jgi:hypothetical protein